MDEQFTTGPGRQVAISGLRDVADWLEGNVLAQVSPLTGLRLQEYPQTKDTLIERMSTLGGPWEIEQEGQTAVRFVRRFGPLATYELYIRSEEVCERREVATPITQYIVSDDLIEAAKTSVGVSV